MIEYSENELTCTILSSSNLVFHISIAFEYRFRQPLHSYVYENVATVSKYYVAVCRTNE